MAALNQSTMQGSPEGTKYIETTEITLTNRASKASKWEVVFTHVTGAEEAFLLEQIGQTGTIEREAGMFLALGSRVEAQLRHKNKSMILKSTLRSSFDAVLDPSGRLDITFDNDPKGNYSMSLKLGGIKTGIEVAGARLQQAVKAMAASGKVMERIEVGIHYLQLILRIGKAASEASEVVKAVVSIAEHIFTEAQEIGQFKDVKEIPATYKKLRTAVRGCLAGLDTLQDASSNFDSRAVNRALEQLINLVIEAAMKFSYAYSNLKLTSIRRPPDGEYVKGLESKLNACRDRILHAYVVEIGGKVTAVARDVQLEFAGLNTKVDKIQDTIAKANTARARASSDDELLDTLLPPDGSLHHGRPGCLPGTRESIKEQILLWAADDTTTSRLFWLNGVAGCGKSSLAVSVARGLGARLAGSFFCKRDEDQRRSSVRLIWTLAFYFAHAIPHYRQAVLNALRKPDVFVNRDLASQFESLVEQPLIETLSATRQHQYVVLVIDALDECEDVGRVASMLSRIVQLAPWMKLIATSRQWPAISHAFQGLEELVQSVDLFDNNAQDDISKLLDYELSPQGRLKNAGPFINSRKDQLVKQSQGLFIWLDTIIKFIAADEENAAQVDKILESSSSEAEASLYSLYHTVVNTAASKTSTSQQVVKMIVGFVLASTKTAALSAHTLHAFLPSTFTLSFQSFMEILGHLGAILKLSEPDDAITAIHTSVLDFFGTLDSSGPVQWLKPVEVQQILAAGCFEIMNAGTRNPLRQKATPSGLKFNICSLQTSYQENSTVLDLKQRIQANISPELQYSSLYWPVHLMASRLAGHFEITSYISAAASTFLCSTQSLYWLEIITLLDAIPSTRDNLFLVDSLDTAYLKDDQTKQVVSELCSFVEQRYAVLKASTPHLYLSLTWLSTGSNLHKLWMSEFPGAQVLQDPIAHTSQLLLRFDLPPQAVIFALSPNKRHLVSGSGDGFVCIWDVTTGALILRTQLKEKASHSTEISEQLQTEPSPIPIDAIAYPLADCILCIAGKAIYTLSAETLEVQKKTDIQLNGVRCMDVTSDSLHIIVGLADGSVFVLNSETCTISYFFKAHTKAVNVVVISPNGTCFATGSDDTTICIWNFENQGHSQKTFDSHQQAIGALAFSPNGKHIVSGDWQNQVLLWSVGSGNQINGTWKAPFCVIFLDYLQEGKHIITGLADQWDLYSSPIYLGRRSYNTGTNQFSAARQGSIQIWHSDILEHSEIRSDPQKMPLTVSTFFSNLKSNKQSGASIQTSQKFWKNMPSSGHADLVGPVAFFQNRNWIVSGSDDCSVRLWNAETGKPVPVADMKHKSEVWTVCLSPDDQYIVSGDSGGVAQVWDADTGKLKHSLIEHTAGVFCCTINSDGTVIATGSRDKTICLWNASNGKLIGRPLTGHEYWVRGVAFLHDNNVLVSCSWDGTIRFWDMLTRTAMGEPISALNGQGIWTSSLSPDGVQLAIVGEGSSELYLWNVQTQTLVGEAMKGHSDIIYSVAFSPDGKYIYSTSRDRTIRRWNTETQQQAGCPLIGHTALICSLAVSPDGAQLVSGADDSTIRVWDMQAFSWDTAVNVADCELRGPERVPASVGEDGWIRTPDGGLLIWVPDEHRSAVCDMSLHCISTKASDKVVKILWDKLCHGENWTDIRRQL